MFVAHDRCEIVAVELDCPAVGVSIDAGDRDDAVAVSLGGRVARPTAGAGRDRILLRPPGSRTGQAAVLLDDGEVDHLCCGGSRRVSLSVQPRDPQDVIENCPNRDGG